MKATALHLMLVLGSLGATAALCEVALRWLEPPASPPPARDAPQQGFMRPEQRTGWQPREGVQLELPDIEGGTQVLRINSTGQRGEEIPARLPGEKRVLLLGDSYTMASQVAEEKTFPALLAHLLPKRVRVINGGVNGYGTYQELAYYRYSGRPLAPDLVVLCFFIGNDFRDNMISTRQGRLLNPVLIPQPKRYWRHEEPLLRDRGERPLSDPLSGEFLPNPTRPWLVSLAQQSALARLIGSRYAQLKGRWTGDLTLLDLSHQYFAYAIGFYQGRDDGVFRTARELTLECLDQLRLLAGEDGAEFAVALLPSLDQVDPAQWQHTLAELEVEERDLGPLDMEYPNRLVREFCQSREIPVLDLLGAFQSAPRPADLYLTAVGDGHLSAAGHRLVGQSLATWMESQCRLLRAPAIDPYREGLRLMDREDWPGAEQSLREAVSQQPAWHAPHAALGEVYSRTGQWRQAAAAYGRALANAPALAGAREGLAESLAQLGDAQGATEAYEKALQRQPEWWPYHQRLAHLYTARGMAAAATAHQQQVDAVYSGPGPIRRFWWAEHISRAGGASARKRWQVAEEELGRAIRFVPDEPTSYYNLGWLYQQTNRADQAIGAYQRALELAPDFAPAQERLHVLLSNTADHTY